MLTDVPGFIETAHPNYSCEASRLLPNTTGRAVDRTDPTSLGVPLTQVSRDPGDTWSVHQRGWQFIVIYHEFNNGYWLIVVFEWLVLQWW